MIIDKTKTNAVQPLKAIDFDENGDGIELSKYAGVQKTDMFGKQQNAAVEEVDKSEKNVVIEFAKQHIESGATINSDAYRSYNALATEFNHQPIKFNVKDNPDHLKWLHTMISNAKAFIGGTFHGLASKHLQSNLDEFCFRTNRRQFEGQSFNRLLTACVYTDTITCHDLTA